MQNFDAIRPYRDHEVPTVIARLVRDPALRHAAAHFLMPRVARALPQLAEWLTGQFLERRTRAMLSVADVQAWLEGYMTRLIDETVHELSVTGLDRLPTDQSYLFISNHRDIVLDSGLLNYAIYHEGHQTARPAVGDNLVTEHFAADLMRLNKSFVVERSVSGRRALYEALRRTSAFIRQSLAQGHSVWIAQREGRAKDGFDRTDPALLKMLALAWREEVETLGALLDHIRLVPVSISYELDPCDQDKAHELTLRLRDGEYSKAPDEDLTSIVRGLTGYKGRVHLHFSAPLAGLFEDAETLALAVDRAIVGGLKVFPTQAAAARRLGLSDVPDAGDWLSKVEIHYQSRLASCPPAELPQLLHGYANVIRNRNELGAQRI